ncbi:hypothetical protein LOTGIDRAFT_164102 [Lottia gigantea]|uniref:Phospholipase A2-like domain-containing protein n=1 Tax=Lottia gigantea TaxID=225164 RepID=V3ZH05_LOTGI|nr:hypothetical protein LOTGIDRAFT_164102 [Lottia gigantea]ESO90513.1 hypothetical protein LOTGIDRAFT_164102 [Lottia gigantea]
MKQGMTLEIQDLAQPNLLWLVKIIENVGGRLYLRYVGVESGTMDFWLFYLDVRLHPIGWCKERNYTYKPPKFLVNSEYRTDNLDISLTEALEEAEKQILPLDIFKDQKEIVPHKFQKGMKLEALHPVTRNQIFPATVVEILDEYYFIVELDDVSMDTENKKIVQFAAYSNISTIFPMHWCQWKGIKISFPRGYDKQEFNWSEYLNDNEAVSAPEFCFTLINEQDEEDHEFEKGMKLEAVSRENANQICAATITKIVGHLMWVHLDNSMKMVASHVEDVYSHNLYPVGWCESNGYQLKPPRKTGLNRASSKRVAIVQPERPLQGKEDDCGMYAKIKQGETENIQKSLGSLPGFPWAKYLGEKHLRGHNYTGPGTSVDLRLDENDKPKPVEEPVNRVDAATLKHDILYRNKDAKQTNK